MMTVAYEFGLPINTVELMTPDVFAYHLAYIKIVATEKNKPQGRGKKRRRNVDSF